MKRIRRVRRYALLGGHVSLGAGFEVSMPMLHLVSHSLLMAHDVELNPLSSTTLACIHAPLSIVELDLASETVSKLPN